MGQNFDDCPGLQQKSKCAKIICYTVYLFRVLCDILQKRLIQHVIFLEIYYNYFFFTGNNDWIIQVTSDTIRLLDGVKQVQSLPLDFDSPIVHVR